MPSELDDLTVSKIIVLAGLGYDKKEIADELEINRNTVTKHLKEQRERGEDSDIHVSAVVAKHAISVLNKEGEWHELD